ncbi:RagB/SusD family nutrient uptake outer membrane protein [Runella aurantiaca]|uniref:RagB/SusD family nutrient uptake outer membrane protein n=1 Tax=Runella aurantiaca TaxID=2282308 RepID=A0A369IGT1_9BACT|nr:RagB/SusD family nutrient uptake outer membrane protein [Runella aurantiaca]RDB07970.1 RagB/SusD family nutrient uptake outer membrane protein [Runella aurantiaca]
MKKISTIISLLLIAGVLISCNDLLVENPVGLATADSYYSTPKGIEDGLKATYTPLRNFYGREHSFFLTVTGTDMYTNGFGGATNNPDYNNYSPNFLGSSAYVKTIWDNFYVGINQANAVIGRAPKVAGLNAVQRNRIIGEARFLRALYYFHLVEQYGDIHFTLEETQGVETEAKRTSVATVYQQGIIPDLQFAVANLPAKAQAYGQATKHAAEGLLARVQLTLGNWAEAEKMAAAVINSNNHSLVKNYSDLWDITKELNTEVIWSVQYTDNPLTNGPGNQGHLYFQFDYTLNPAMTRDVANGRPFQRFMPTNYTLNLFDLSKDSRFDGTFKTVWIANTKATINGKTVQPGDTAIKIVMRPVADAVQKAAPYWLIDYNNKWVGSVTDQLEIGGSSRRQFPTLKKYLDPLRVSVNAEDGRRDFMVLRLAEMYLIAGEAAFRQGNLTKSAEYVNVVRTRAALPGKVAEMQIKSADLNEDFFMDERGRELAGEMLRWYDLKRSGKFLERLKKFNLDAAANVKEMHLVRPIPQTQIDRVTNPGDFPQNPGY